MLMNDWCPLPTNNYSDAAAGDRRMSEPARGYLNQRVSPPMPPRPRSAQLLQLHPNCEVDLDEVGEGELESKLVLPDEMMQYLQQSQGQSMSNPSYRNSPLPCRSPICTNAQHCLQRSQQQHQCHNYNVQQHQAQQPQQQCYQESNPQTPAACPSYSSVGSPYSQCSNSRQTSGYCPPANFAQVPSPGQVMSPGSHYAPSHISEPMTSPQAGALAPPQVVQNPHQNSAQLSRNCPQNAVAEHGSYYQASNYGCQSQVVNNCNAAAMAQQMPPRPLSQSCASMHGPTCRPPSVACQPMSPHCVNQPTATPIEAVASPHPRPMSTGPPLQQQQHQQCNLQMSTDQCSVVAKPNVMAPAMSPAIIDQCPRSVASFSSQPSPASQNPSDFQVQSPCSQMSGGACIHPPPLNHHPMHTMPKEAARGCAPGTCHAQYCCQNTTQQNLPQQQQQQQPMQQQQPQQQIQRYNGCGNDCQQWAAYNNVEHCCGNRHNAPEIQCRDISQSQQGSPMKLPQGMHQDSYRRTLEYVQQCRNWSGTNMSHVPETSVTSSTHPMTLPQALPSSVNMIVNDMTSSLSSLTEENRFLQMIQ